MDFIVTLFLYGIFNLFFPKKEEHNAGDDLENGAAYFFSNADLNQDGDKVNDDYDNGPEW